MSPSQAAVADQPPVENSVPLRQIVDSAELLRAFRDGLGTTEFGTRRGLLSIDMRDSRQFDVVAMIYLLSLMSPRRAGEMLARFRLPENLASVGRLRLQRFFEAAAAVARVPQELLLALEDVGRLGAAKTYPLWDRSTSDTIRQMLHHLWSQRLFGFAAYQIDSIRDKVRTLDAELERWSSPLALALFQRLLQGPEWDVARVVMQELLAHVMRERTPAAAAETVVVASDMSVPTFAPTAGPPGLTIAVWDDGEPIVKALRERVATRPATPSDLELPLTLDSFRFDGVERAMAPHVVGSDWRPGAAANDNELLLTSLFPAVAGEAWRESSPGGESADRLRGHELRFVYRSAVDDFNGSLELRCGIAGICVDKDPDQPGRYRVRPVGASVPPLACGNLVVARLPAHDR